MKKSCKITWFNCFIGMFYLYFRGKVNLVGILLDKRDWSYHFVGFNQKGRMIHFKTNNRQSSNRWWFKGRFETISAKAVGKIMKHKKFIKLW